ncbi:MAG: sigma-70 family RNA polymerase sigma factor [Chitinophagaceae bacterium]
MRNEEDLLLWQSFKQGDWDAYSRLYNFYFGLLNNYGYRFTKEKELIEDAVHDLFVRLWTSRERLSDPESVKNYLFKSMRNILLRKMKGEEKFTDIDGQEYPLAFSISYGSETLKRIEDRELREKIRVFIEKLPPRQQEIIFLRFYEGLSYEEIADVMSISTNSAYKLLYKALDNLQTTFGTSSTLSILLSLNFFPKFFSA